MYIYIYIEREREIERERVVLCVRSLFGAAPSSAPPTPRPGRPNHEHACIVWYSVV